MQPMRGWRPGLVWEDPMIYMVEMDFPHPERLPEWHDWYLAHIRVLLTVRGFRASQRFQAVASGRRALPRAARGFRARDVRERRLSLARRAGLDRRMAALQTNWRRNLLEGLDETPDVPADRHVLLLDEARDVSLPAGIGVTWLRGVGLDSTIRNAVSRC